MRALLVALSLLFGTAAQAQTQIYVGAFGTAAFIDSIVRQNGVEAVDQGGEGLGIGVRAGAGWNVTIPVFLGIEAEFTRHLNASSRLSPADYRATMLWTGGLFLRAGWTINPHGMIYARGGGAATRIQGDETLISPAAGGGVEMTIIPGWSARVDATHYFPAGEDKFESTIFTFGLTRRF